MVTSQYCLLQVFCFSPDLMFLTIYCCYPAIWGIFQGMSGHRLFLCVKCYLCSYVPGTYKVLSTMSHAYFQAHTPSLLSATSHLQLPNPQERNQAFRHSANPRIHLPLDVNSTGSKNWRNFSGLLRSQALIGWSL